MTRRELVLALVAISLSAACKSGNGFTNNGSKPNFSYAQGSLSCGDAGQDPDGGTGATLVVCALDFGGVPIGQTSTANISLENDSATPYNVLSQSLPSDPQFGVQRLPLPTQVVDNVPLAVSFKPFGENQLSDSFYITTDTQAASKVLFNLTGSGINIAVALNPTNLDFGKVIIHSTEQKTMVVQNLSTGPITLSPLVPAGNAASLFSVAILNADFTASGTPYTYATPIPPMGTVTFGVTFAPTQQSYADEIAYLTLTYASDKYVNVGLKGFGVKTGLLVTTGPVATNPPVISFGHIPLNNSVTDYVYVQNISNQTIKLYQSYMDNNAGGIFTVAPPGSSECLNAPPQPAMGEPPNNCQQVTPGSGNYTLNPGDKLTYPIKFAPVYGQGYVGDFSVADDHGDNVTVPISGGGGGPAITCKTLPATPLVACDGSDAGVGAGGGCLELDFGEVAVDIGAALSLVCTNTGNDITLKGKIDPTAELQVLQSGLTFTQAGASFSAQLFQSGQLTQFVSLRAGEQFVVQVTYNPTVANSVPETGKLHIASNAVLTPTIPVLLSGTGLVLTDCNLTIAPISLNFEQVTTGQTALLPVTLTNNGNNACLINGLSLSPSTDSAFTIASVTAPDAGSIGALGASPPTSVKLCGTAEPASDKCTSPYGSEYQVLVQFKPSVIGTYQGLLDFIVSSRSAPAQDVPLSGTAGTGCLIISPQELDFGNVGIKSGNTYCKTDSRKIRALNTCGTPLIVSGLVNSPESTDFHISSSPQLPFPLQVGLTFEWEEQFEPGSAGAKYGSANVVAAPSGGTPQTYLAAFHGTASDTRQQVDTFNIPPKKVDIIWVINYSDWYNTSYVLGISPNNQTASNFLPSLTNYFSALGSVDYHLAVVANIDCVSSYQYGDMPSDFISAAAPGVATIQGDLQVLPCSGCTDPSSGTAQIITSADMDPAGEMNTILTNMNNNYFDTNIYWESYGCPVKASGIYENLGNDILQPAYDALTASVQAGHNQGFYRDDAALVIVGLSPGDDGSTYLTGNPLNYYYTYFENLKGFNPLTPFIFNTIGVTPAEAKANQEYCPGGYNIYLGICNTCGAPNFTLVNNPVMVAETGGQIVDICTTDWGASMTSLGQTSSAALTSFTLSGSPVNPPSGIQVAISGAIIPQYTVDGGAPIWTYDAVTGTLTFPNSANAPGSGDVLTITYDNVCF